MLDEKTPLIVTVGSGLMIGVGIFSFHLLLCIPLWRLKSANFKKSWAFMILRDLNFKRRFFSFIYFGHFIVMWSIIALLILITPSINSKTLWITLTSIQFISLLTHTLKLYRLWSAYLFALIWEMTILQVFLSLSILEFRDQTTQEKWFIEYNRFKIVHLSFICLYTAVSLMFLLAGICSTIYKLINRFRQWWWINIETIDQTQVS